MLCVMESEQRYMDFYSKAVTKMVGEYRLERIKLLLLFICASKVVRNFPFFSPTLILKKIFIQTSLEIYFLVKY